MPSLVVDNTTNAKTATLFAGSAASQTPGVTITPAARSTWAPSRSR